MTPKQQLLEEIKDISPANIKSILDYARFLKAQQHKVDVMKFSGMLADKPELVESILEVSENNRQTVRRQDCEPSAP